MINKIKARFIENVTEEWVWVFAGAMACIVVLVLSLIVRGDPLFDGMFWYLAIGTLLMWVAGTSATLRTFKTRHANREVIIEVVVFLSGACLVLGSLTVICVMLGLRALYVLYMLGF